MDAFPGICLAHLPEVTFSAGTVLDLAGNDLGALDTSASWLLGDFSPKKTCGSSKSGEINQPHVPFFLAGFLDLYDPYLFFCDKKRARVSCLGYFVGDEKLPNYVGE